MFLLSPPSCPVMGGGFATFWESVCRQAGTGPQSGVVVSAEADIIWRWTCGWMNFCTTLKLWETGHNCLLAFTGESSLHSLFGDAGFRPSTVLENAAAGFEWTGSVSYVGEVCCVLPGHTCSSAQHAESHGTLCMGRASEGNRHSSRSACMSYTCLCSETHIDVRSYLAAGFVNIL